MAKEFILLINRLEALESTFNLSVSKITRTIGCRHRQLLFTTPHLYEHISGVILYEETYNQFSDIGVNFADLLNKQLFLTQRLAVET
ncbi:hypothetical protein KIN20_007880 [Parelaphostrongylus tenuis]|uniref:fructose-bisphosphate aldolase n=1 Tax=Parelaphostrongylus tenuis TaxID=148309 RepID=A0AAD5QI78_PARTN|nr:hypothetical protein KIN20_007880 [Parelaphostrongylus tenuis]